MMRSNARSLRWPASCAPYRRASLFGRGAWMAALAVLLMFGAVGQVSAQTAPAPAATAPAAASAVDVARQQLDQIEATLKRSSLTDVELSQLRERIEPLTVSVEQAIAALTPQISAADARLAQIGPKPAEGQAESDEVAGERTAQTTARQGVEDAIKRGRLLIVEAAQVGDEITQRRRDMLAQRLFERSRSLLDPTLWVDFLKESPRDMRAARYLFTDWAAVISRAFGPAQLALVGFAALVALLIAIPGRRWGSRVGQRLLDAQMPKTRLRRSATGLLFVVVSALGPVLAALSLYWGLRLAGWLPQRADRLAIAFVYAAGYLGLVYGLMQAFLTPGKPSWRLLDLSDEAIAEIRNQPFWCALVFVCGRLIYHFNEMIVASLAASIVINGVFALLSAGAFAIALRRIRAAKKVEERLAAEGVKEEGQPQPLIAILRSLAWIAVTVSLLSLVSGHIALAQFLANQVVWIATVLSLLYLLLIVINDLFTSGLSSETDFGRGLSEATGIRSSHLEQIGVVLSGVFRVALMGFAALLILAPWGFESTDIFGWLRIVISGFTVGGIAISLPGVLGAILLVVVGFALTRFIQRWLDKDLLPKTRMDTGLKASINTGVGYLGGLMVIVVAVSYLGFSLDRLAIVAGALSVGIGFGLQAVISNFVSGVILLAERPIKAGDWIVIGSDQGNVRRISVRSTEIELFDRSTLIVPNSDFITKSVKNVTHGAPLGRVQIELSVAADVDPAKVRKVMLDTARAHGSVLGFPEPSVLFTALGKAENTFALFASVPSPRQAATVKSDLNFALVKAFADQGVGIGGAAPPSMVDAIDRIGQMLGRSGFVKEVSEDRPALAPATHDASAAPLTEPPPADPQTGGVKPSGSTKS